MNDYGEVKKSGEAYPSIIIFSFKDGCRDKYMERRFSNEVAFERIDKGTICLET